MCVSALAAEEAARADERAKSIENLRQSCRSLGIASDKMLIGFASSMDKILPRDVPVKLRAAKSIDISAARNEKESFQIAVTPAGAADLKKVVVKATDLRSKDGNVLTKVNIKCDVVGYVQTKEAPPYPMTYISYIGWWPDPILNFLGPVDVKAGDVQSFWIRICVPRSQKPGVYSGKIVVSADGVAPVKLGLSVKVRAFAVPDCSPLPTAITFLVPEFKDHIINDICGKENWHKKLKFAWADFLADYYINFDSLYERAEPPDYEVLKHLHDQGRLVASNFGNFDSAGTKDNSGNDPGYAVRKYKPVYEKCRQMGILDHAYIYGFDERPKEEFQSLEDAAKALKQAFPEVLLMTTAYDNSYGMDSVVKSMDAWCPLTPSFDPKNATTARAGGRKVWWYICCGPHNPFANWFVEYHAIEARLLMGAMTAKYHPDGFLYYSLAYWNTNKPISTGPFTDWNPVSWGAYHGDGSILCCGPGGVPVPTIRLENYRDGLEDFAYAKILEEIIRKYDGKGDSQTSDERKWLADARKALVVPEALVKTMESYSRDPDVLYSWRERVADLIDSSGMTDTDPWGKNFGVRGFRNK